ncbi:MAG: hypothetical protein V1749_05865 [Candidatus Desantisbacteria bacterium]
MESILIGMGMIAIFGVIMVGIALYSDHKKKIQNSIRVSEIQGRG